MKLLFDFFPIILFFLAYKQFDIFVATGVAIVATIVQVAVFWLKNRRFEKMHLITLALVVTLGGATLLLNDKAFFMWKPTAVNWLFGLVFLGSQFIGEKTLVERMMSQAVDAPRETWKRLNLAWVVFFILMGCANLYVANFYFHAEAALNAAAGLVVDLESCATLSSELLALCNEAKSSEEDWVNFKLFGLLGLTVLFVIGQAFYLAKHFKDDEITGDSDNAADE